MCHSPRLQHRNHYLHRQSLSPIPPMQDHGLTCGILVMARHRPIPRSPVIPMPRMELTLLHLRSPTLCVYNRRHNKSSFFLCLRSWTLRTIHHPACQPLTVQFTNLSQFADPSTYSWDFGDGGSSHATNPVYTYFNAGTYTVSLSASNITGQTITAIPSSLSFLFSSSRWQISKSHRLSFIFPEEFCTPPISARMPQGIIGILEMGRLPPIIRPEHVYKTDGTFTITLVASNESGCTDTTQQVDAVIVKKEVRCSFQMHFHPAPKVRGMATDTTMYSFR